MQDIGTEKKKKGKPSMGRLRFLRFLGLFLLFACIVITILTILGPIINGQIRQTSLATEYIPIATTLLNAPARALVESENITLEPWAVKEDSHNEVDYVCISVNLNYEVRSETMERYDNSRLFVNRSWVIGAVHYEGQNLLSSSVRWCGRGELEAGIHLIEFELRDSMFGEPIYTHQWAIEIEAD
jgi:hypothetical protein